MYKFVGLPAFLVIALVVAPSLLAGQTYYWVGDSGNWSDISHWATSSGGSVFHTQAPTAEDEVVFDDNSFTLPDQVVTLDNNLNFCKSLTISTGSTAVLSMTSGKSLSIHGNLVVSPSVRLEIDGSILLRSEEAGSILDLSGRPGITDLEINAGGHYDLRSELLVGNTFTLLRGSLASNDHNITCSYFHSPEDLPRELNLGRSTLFVTGTTILGTIAPNHTPTFLINTDQLTFDPGNSLIEVSSDLSYIWLDGSDPIRFHKIAIESTTAPAIWGYFDEQFDTFIIPPPVQVDHLEFRSSADLYNDGTIDTFVLSAGNQYRFEPQAVTDINHLEAEGDCEGTITLSSLGAIESYIYTEAALSASFVSVANIHKQGTGSITATNSIDRGNTDGWDIQSKTPETFYWIGGTGAWSDPGHWSYNSGGGPAGCLPTAFDDVIFDANSFTADNQTVEVDQGTAYCRTIDWRGIDDRAVLSGPQQSTIEVSGSLYLAPQMAVEFLGDFKFDSNSQNEILTSGHMLLGNLSLNGRMGSWTLLDSLSVQSEIELVGGSFISNGQDIKANHLISQNSEERTLDISDSHITLYYNLNLQQTEPNLTLKSDGLTMRAANSHIRFEGATSGRAELSGDEDLELNILEGCSHYIRVSAGHNATFLIDSLILKSNGAIQGMPRTNTTILTPGREYTLGNGTILTTENLIAQGNCESGMVYLMPSAYSNSYSLNISNDVTLDRVFMQGAQQIGQGNIMVTNGVDGGYNSNISFMNTASANLYWVNGSGDWFDQDHWSYTSGGPGGACIPTLADNVIIDANSFPSGSDGTITNEAEHQTYCDSLMVRQDVLPLRLDIDNINATGSILLDQEIDLGNSIDLRLLGNKTKQLRTNGSTIGFLHLAGQDTIYQDGPLDARVFWHFAGDYYSQGFPILTSILEQRNLYDHSTIWLDNSRVTFGSSFGARLRQFSDCSIKDQNAVVDFNHINCTVTAEGNISLNKLIFSNPEGNAVISRLNNSGPHYIRHLQFNGNGDLLNDLTVDSLVFTAGSMYKFEPLKSYQINNYWLARGNNCLPLEIRSNSNSENAVIAVGDDINIIADFVQMERITLEGNQAHPAGANSTNINNSNVGWIFGANTTADEVVGFLGDDRYLCNTGQSIQLSANNYNPGEQYLWSTGSTDQAIATDTDGSYWAEVTFANGCTIRDSIEVLTASAFEVDLGEDLILCEGTTVQLQNQSPGSNLLTYEWNTEAQSETLEVDTSGIYWLRGNLQSCSDSDTIVVEVIARPDLQVGNDTTLCGAPSLELEATTMAGTISWSTGDAGPMTTVDTSGLYIVEAYDLEGCSSTDTIAVRFVSVDDEVFGPDTTLCTASSFELEGLAQVDTYEWNTGSTDPSITVSQSGVYSVSMSISGCTITDSIRLTFFEGSQDPIARDTLSQCEGENISIMAPSDAQGITWSDGSSVDSFYTETPGLYSLSLDYGACMVTDTFYWEIKPLPTLQPLASDTSICAGNSLTLSTSTDIGMVIWEDGSSTTERLVSDAGTYVATAEHQGCSTSDTIVVSLLPTATSDLLDLYEYCEGDTAIITSMASYDDILWSDGSTDDLVTVDAGIYYVTMQVGPCQTQDTFEIAYRPLPMVELGTDTVLCAGTSITIDAGQVAQWQDGAMQESITVSQAGTYRASVTVDGCTNQDTIAIDYYSRPSLPIDPSYSVCAGETVVLELPRNIQAVEWYDGDTSYLKTIEESGRFSVAFRDPQACTYLDSFEVVYTPLPSLSLGPDQSACLDESVTVEANTNATLIEWQGQAPSSSLIYEATGEEVVIATVTEEGCSTTDTVLIDLVECMDFAIGIPNIFSPNGDGRNDYFEITCSDPAAIEAYHLRVVDRWGSTVFESTDIQRSWDGMYRGQKASQGVYVYFLQVQTSDSRHPTRRSGTVTIP